MHTSFVYLVEYLADLHFKHYGEAMEQIVRIKPIGEEYRDNDTLFYSALRHVVRVVIFLSGPPSTK